MILILTALESEARAVRRAVGPTADVRPIGIRAGRLPQHTDAEMVLLCGLAGGLNPRLRVGNLVLDDPAGILEISNLKFEKMRLGRIHTASAIVATPADKAALFESTGADAVDMEQSIVKQWCARRGLPLVGLRAISDTASQTLAPAVLGFVDDLGRPKPGKIAAELLRRPGLIPCLMRLNADTKLALRNLAGGVRTIVDAIPSV